MRLAYFPEIQNDAISINSDHMSLVQVWSLKHYSFPKFQMLTVNKHL